jgi:hypothetical protein
MAMPVHHAGVDHGRTPNDGPAKGQRRCLRPPGAAHAPPGAIRPARWFRAPPFPFLCLGCFGAPEPNKRPMRAISRGCRGTFRPALRRALGNPLLVSAFDELFTALGTLTCQPFGRRLVLDHRVLDHRDLRLGGDHNARDHRAGR